MLPNDAFARDAHILLDGYFLLFSKYWTLAWLIVKLSIKPHWFGSNTFLLLFLAQAVFKSTFNNKSNASK